MKKLCMMLTVACAAVVGQAEQYWAALYSAAYAKGDTAPETANRPQYTAYYCTVAAAADLFNGASDVAGVSDYLEKNFAKGKSALDSSKDSVELTGGDFGLNQYSFIAYSPAALADTTYLAVAFYGDSAFRVFGADSAVYDSGRLTFTDKNAAAGTVGDWTSNVPEPTSGLLLLLGMAGLALRRKRA